MNNLQANRHRRVASQAEAQERHTYGGQANPAGYLFCYNRKKSLQEERESDFQQIAERIDKKMALNISRKSNSKGRRENSLVTSRNGSRNVSITRKDDKNSNIFRVTGKNLSLKGLNQHEKPEQAYQLRQNCSPKASLINHPVSHRNQPEQPQIRQQYSQKYFQPLERTRTGNLLVNVRVEVNAQPQPASDPYTNHNILSHRFVHNPNQSQGASQDASINRERILGKEESRPKRAYDQKDKREPQFERAPAYSRLEGRFSTQEEGPSSIFNESSMARAQWMSPVEFRKKEIQKLLEDPICAFLYEQVTKQSYLKKIKELFSSKPIKERSKSLLNPCKFLTNKIL